MALVTHAADILVRLPSPSARPSCIWDHAGSCLIVTEAGGRVTDLDGRALDFGAGRYLARNRGLVATMPAAIHPRVLGLVDELAAADDNDNDNDNKLALGSKL
ncbi:hypothetical protein CDD82_6111 [Ophiocordyceps australis]|uniref:3'(2'),5'-bisphosphate nucleotidase n=1 Tax=Ophiocordyceps australis TaxID=1399860 RepID=A0A2C5YRS1_9HYPO|nr:hypothetical protein CDD82_6111 [Ophiocordyceps australis]